MLALSTVHLSSLCAKITPSTLLHSCPLSPLSPPFYLLSLSSTSLFHLFPLSLLLSLSPSLFASPLFSSLLHLHSPYIPILLFCSLSHLSLFLFLHSYTVSKVCFPSLHILTLLTTLFLTYLSSSSPFLQPYFFTLLN